jgi:hypothetical protein
MRFKLTSLLYGLLLAIIISVLPAGSRAAPLFDGSSKIERAITNIKFVYLQHSTIYKENLVGLTASTVIKGRATNRPQHYGLIIPGQCSGRV